MKPINLKRASLAEYFYSLMDLLLSNLHFFIKCQKTVKPHVCPLKS